MTTHADREAIAEELWPGTAARGIHELNRRLITIYLEKRKARAATTTLPAEPETHV